MHAELVVPGLLQGAATKRFPALEMLLARGRINRTPAMKIEEWLQRAFELEALAAGALTLLGCGRDPGEANWARADPVHLRLMREHVIVVPAEALELSREETDALCEALNRHFPDLQLTACEPRYWCAQVAEGAFAGGASALESAGTPAALPHEAAGLVNEIQMLLHAHPVNEAREARGDPTVNSLWLWGAGRAPRTARTPWQSVAADDPVALGAARLAGARHRPLARSADEWLGRLPDEGRHLGLLDMRGSQDVSVLEQTWFAPLLAALRSGRIGMLTIHIPDAAEAVSCETIRGDLRRFWRRAKPIEHYA
jgi:hypothetical protein